MADKSERPKVRLRVLRQDAPDQPSTRRFEDLEVDRHPHMTIHDCLEAVRRKPCNAKGAPIAPVAWEASCLEEVCGACTMLIQGRPRQACATLVDEVSPKGQVVVLEPLSKFPVERDLIVDRSKMFDALTRVRAWIELDGSAASAPLEGRAAQRERYELSSCIACGACLEACPEVHDRSAFVGAAALNEVRALNRHPGGQLDRGERLEAVMADGGVADCGKAQNCVEVCPKALPLVDSIGELARDTTWRWLFGWRR